MCLATTRPRNMVVEFKAQQMGGCSNNRSRSGRFLGLPVGFLRRKVPRTELGVQSWGLNLFYMKISQGQFRTKNQSRCAQAHTVVRPAYLLLHSSLHSTSLPSFKAAGVGWWGEAKLAMWL